MPRISPLLYAASERDADQLYFSKVFVPDAFLSFAIGEKKYALVNRLEYHRVCREGTFDSVLSLEAWLEKAKQHYGRSRAQLTDIIRLIADKWAISAFRISPYFPAGLALKLRDAGVQLHVAEDGLFPERAVKTAGEREAIREASTTAAAGIQSAEHLLRESHIQSGKLYYQGQLLTAERVRQAIGIACLNQGAIAGTPIVAGGNQACDPHCIGHGPLLANTLIVVDVFPRVVETGYYGDMTRTFLKGRASEGQRRQVATVWKVQQQAIKELRAAINGERVHHRAVQSFRQAGYKNTETSERSEGFIHGLGHGLGLTVHEAPSLSPRGGKLEAGTVVTVEPGLYYHDTGGCRIEDVVAITKDGVEPLSQYHYHWELK